MRRLLVLPLLVLAGSCRRDAKPDVSFYSWLPATATALTICEPPAACRATAFERKFKVAAHSAGATAVMFQNEYSPAILLPATTVPMPAGGAAKTYRERSYTAAPNPLRTRTSSPADGEAWARFTLPSGQTVLGGEAAIFDVIDVAAGLKPSLLAARPELEPLLVRFGSQPTVEYSFTAPSQQQGIEGGLEAILGSWPVKTVLGPVTSYRGRASRLERDGARCRMNYGVQLSSSVAARLLSGAMTTALSAGTLAGWPLGPEYLAKWGIARDGELVTASLDLTKAGCEHWER